MGNNVSSGFDIILDVFDEPDKQETLNKNDIVYSVSSSSISSNDKCSSSNTNYKDIMLGGNITTDSNSITSFINFNKNKRPQIYGNWNNNNNELTTTENNDTVLSEADHLQNGGYRKKKDIVKTA